MPSDPTIGIATDNPRPRGFGRSIILTLAILVVLAGVLSWCGTRTASAGVLYQDRFGPAAGADKFGNVYLFWKGTGGQLEEGWYDKYDNRWNGPINLHMAPLGSEPTVAVSAVQSARGPGDHLYAWQYVYWAGSGSAHSLYMAYWNGSWHGPIDLGMGPLKIGPTASGNAQGGTGSQNIYWDGQDNNVWYAYSTTYDATSARDYSGPHSAHYGGRGLGPLGSSPSASIDTCSDTIVVCNGYADGVVWRGTNYRLWYSQYDTLFNAWKSGPQELSAAGKILSPPSIVEDPVQTSTYIAWAGSNCDLWYEASFHPKPIDLGFYMSSEPELTWTDPSGTALGGIVYAFWEGSPKSSSRYGIYEAYYVEKTGQWHGPYDRGMGPLPLPGIC